MDIETYSMKAKVFVECLPYIRDFHGCIAVLELLKCIPECLVEDIALLYGIGIKPVLLCEPGRGKELVRGLRDEGLRAIEIDHDVDAMLIMIEKGYICVVETCDSLQDVLQLTQRTEVDKLIMIDDMYKDMPPVLVSIKDIMVGDQKEIFERAIRFSECGVNRVHMIRTIPHGVILELFSINGIGTAIMKAGGQPYHHEIEAEE